MHWYIWNQCAVCTLQVSNATLATISHDTRIDWLVGWPSGWCSGVVTRSDIHALLLEIHHEFLIIPSTYHLSKHARLWKTVFLEQFSSTPRPGPAFNQWHFCFLAFKCLKNIHIFQYDHHLNTSKSRITWHWHLVQCSPLSSNLCSWVAGAESQRSQSLGWPGQSCMEKKGWLTSRDSLKFTYKAVDLERFQD